MPFSAYLYTLTHNISLSLRTLKTSVPSFPGRSSCKDLERAPTYLHGLSPRTYQAFLIVTEHFYNMLMISYYVPHLRSSSAQAPLSTSFQGQGPNVPDFCKISVKYLGLIVSEGTRALGEDRIGPISTYPLPKTLKQLRGFLGITSYCRLWIPGYGEIAGPLYHLI